MSQDTVRYMLQLRDELSEPLRQVQKNAERMNSSMRESQNVVSGLRNTFLGFFAAHEFVQFGRDSLNVAAKMQSLGNVIKYTSIDAADAAKNQEFLHKMVSDLKLPLIETTEGFSQFNASMLGSKLQGEQARRIFEGVSVGLTALQLGPEKASKAFYALNQMMSKGTVNAEELKGQLGDALPGSFKIAADAMGMTQAKFGKMMQEGKIMASDFLPKFAQQMKETFQGAIPDSIKSLQAQMTDFDNKVIDLKLSVGQLVAQGFLKLYPYIVQTFEYVKRDVLPVLKQWGHYTAEVMRWIKDHQEFAKAVLLAAGSYIAITEAIKGFNSIMEISKAAMLTNPWILLGVTLAGIVYYINEIIEKNKQLIGGTQKNNPAMNAYHSSVESRAENEELNELVERGKKYKDMFKLIQDEKQRIEKLMLNDNLTTDAANLLEAKYKFLSENPIDKLRKKRDEMKLKGGAANPSADSSLGLDKVTGQKSTTINISIKTLVEHFNINTTNLTESTGKIREIIIKELVAATNDAQVLCSQ